MFIHVCHIQPSRLPVDWFWVLRILNTLFLQFRFKSHPRHFLLDSIVWLSGITSSLSESMLYAHSYTDTRHLPDTDSCPQDTWTTHIKQTKCSISSPTRVQTDMYLYKEGSISYFSVDRVQAVGERDDYSDEVLWCWLSFMIKALPDFSLSAQLLQGCLQYSTFLPLRIRC